MRTAVDSSVLLAILKEEPGYKAWQRALEKASTDGMLVICAVAFAEIAPPFASSAALLEHLEALAIGYDDISPEAAWLAGRSFRAYRQAGGPRQHLIPDFLVGAHAQAQADRLAAIDRGYLRHYFPRLILLQP